MHSMSNLSEGQLWTHILPIPSARPSTHSRASALSAAPALSPADKTGTTLRLLLQDTKSTLEKFSGRLDHLFVGLEESKQSVLAFGKHFDGIRDSMLDEARCIVNVAQKNIESHIGKPVQEESLANFKSHVQKTMEDSLSKVDHRLELMDSHIRNISMQHSQLIAALAAVATLVPLSQVISKMQNNQDTTLTDSSLANSENIRHKDDRKRHKNSGSASSQTRCSQSTPDLTPQRGSKRRRSTSGSNENHVRHRRERTSSSSAVDEAPTASTSPFRALEQKDANLLMTDGSAPTITVIQTSPDITAPISIPDSNSLPHTPEKNVSLASHAPEEEFGSTISHIEASPKFAGGQEENLCRLRNSPSGNGYTSLSKPLPLSSNATNESSHHAADQLDSSPRKRLSITATTSVSTEMTSIQRGSYRPQIFDIIPNSISQSTAPQIQKSSSQSFLRSSQSNSHHRAPTVVADNLNKTSTNSEGHVSSARPDGRTVEFCHLNQPEGDEANDLLDLDFIFESLPDDSFEEEY